jgi:putative hemolysin
MGMRGLSPETPPSTPALLGDRTNLVAERKGVREGAMDKLLALDQLRDLYVRSRSGSQPDFHQNLLQDLQVSCHVEPGDLAHIPTTGPVVAVSNHPFGILEGPILCTVLPKVRPDFKIMTNLLLACMPELEKHCVFVDPFNSKKSRLANALALKQAIAWLKAGHMLVIFPAGEVSHWNFRHKEVEDPEWNQTAARLVRMAKATSVPMFFKGKNSIPFHLLGMVHPTLRTARLAHELFNKRGKNIELLVGSSIPFDTIAEIPEDTDATRYLRWRSYLLGNRGETGIKLLPGFMPKKFGQKAQQPIADETPRELLAGEIENLPASACMEGSREYAVYFAASGQIPNLLKEIGRLRELTFREVGEGTGKASDLDSFDPYYQHLLLWHKQKQELVGAYRIGNVKEILDRFGIRGLYTNTLFQYGEAFFEMIGSSLELGRSFVRPEYQKKYAPLLMLWKGLGSYISRNPGVHTLFGAVSISNDYNPVSRQLVTRFLEDERANRNLAGLVKARRPLRRLRNAADEISVRHFFRDLDSLSAVISDMEVDGKGVPVLLKQYVKLGGKLLGFNVDPHFSDALDGLVLVDLRETEPEILDRYMGKEGAARFLEHHWTTAAAASFATA